jgi:acyl carrier protein
MPPALGAATLLADVTAAIRHVLRRPDLTVRTITRLEDIPGWDAADLIPVLVELECRFGVLCAQTEVDSLVTVGDLVTALAWKCEAAAA